MVDGAARRFGSVALPVTTITALAAITVALWTGGNLNGVICGGECGARAAALPDTLALVPSPHTAVASGTPASPVDAAAVGAAVQQALSDEKLGKRVGFAAVDPRTGEVLVSQGEKTAYVPASTTKILTAFAVLSTLDPQQRFVTSVVRSGDQLVLVGGGDPYLMSKPPKESESYTAVQANLRALARRTAAALRGQGVTAVRVGYDASLFSGPPLSPAWEESYVTERIVTPISALWADQILRSQAEDPAPEAAKQFAEFLDEQGVDVRGDPSPAAVPAGTAQVAAVNGPTVAQATELMVSASDNDAAEQLLRHAAVAAGRPGTFADGLAVVLDVLRQRGIDSSGLVLHDGSGLSRHNRIAPVTLAQVIAEAASSPRTAGLIADLPVAQFSGSMDTRFSKAEAGAGIVRAKTGTLKGVHSLAGYVNDANGVPIVFAVMADKTKDVGELETEEALDRVAAALARCTCSAVAGP